MTRQAVPRTPRTGGRVCVPGPARPPRRVPLEGAPGVLPGEVMR